MTGCCTRDDTTTVAHQAFSWPNRVGGLRDVREPYLPDHDSFVGAEPATGRVIVIAPTRAACETIELALGLHIETFLERHHGARVRELARAGRGFGIVAGTGTGKTLAIRPISEEILGTT